MPSTFSNLLFHVVFSVKERMRLLTKDTRNRLYPYISGIASKNSFKILCIDGTNDHIHINNQEAHHKKMSFQEEYIELLKKNNIDFDPKYLF